STSIGPVGGILGNYLFTPLTTNGIYNVAMAVTPTGSVLYQPPCSNPPCQSGYTNPQVAIPLAGYDLKADFPFVTVTPTGSPTATPPFAPATFTPTPPNGIPTDQPTPSPIKPTPSVCIPLPTPILQAPAHELCTNSKPTFSAYVSDPNGENVWAIFYSDAYEKFKRMGTSQLPPYPTGTYSQYVPDAYMLNSNGGYWWTAYTQNSATTCTKSADAPAFLLNMDYSAPPAPESPNCTLQNQDFVSGGCTFSCTWPADPEVDNSCSDTANYHAIFWTSPRSQMSDPGWIGNSLTTTVNTTSDGVELYAQLEAKDSLGNVSSASAIGGPFTCPRLNFSDTPTPGGLPSATPTASNTPTPTITPTPTPGDWMHVQGGDVYLNTINQSTGPNKYFLDELSWDTNNNSVGILWSGNGGFFPGLGFLSSRAPLDLKVAGSLSTANNFTYYWEALKNKATDLSNPGLYPNQTVGKPSDLDATNAIYSYSGQGLYSLDNAFNVNRTNGADVTIFLISGSLDIPKNYSLTDSKDTVVFIVNGNIHVSGNVTNAPGITGLFIASQSFTVDKSANQFKLNGMVYTKTLSLKRTYRSFIDPTYEFIYKPQYAVALLPYLGRSQVNWQEVKP
ncbi:hypothetical protein HY029_00600, partial [Candidatus Gottesmanbacteria bacterium]|nr:hypothetical protein [Candidatus Gottesmanbacteria bacterium]